MLTVAFMTVLVTFVPQSATAPTQPTGDYPIRPVPFTDVHFTDAFWKPRLDTNRLVSVRCNFEQCEKTGRIRNFAIAGKLESGQFEGIHFNDSDVYKVIEGASYSLATHPDPQLDAYLDALIQKIAAAQEPDGYLYTIRTIQGGQITRKEAGATRWSNLAHSHELYNMGHLYEAAVAHFQATGKRTLLDVALRSADLVAATFGPAAGQRRDVPGHPEIELALVKLYRVTGRRDYLDLAKFFIDMRGRADLRPTYGEYCQDHRPVIEQTEPVGHAVRGAYLYSGMADVAAIAGQPAYVQALNRLWEHLVSRRMYLTGGIGAHRHNEGFGDDYDLPNRTAYNETCAAIALALWSQRMFLLHGDSKYVDLLERVIYNAVLPGVSLSGDRFFYPNPLACDGVTPFNQGTLGRADWFACACCPVNVVRFLPSLPGYAYAVRDDVVYVNLYVAGTAALPVADQTVTIRQETRYPWDGTVRLTVTPQRSATLELRLRIPGWTADRPVPGDLYRYADPSTGKPTLSVNGAPAALQLDPGYALLRREFSPGDVVQLDLPMHVRRAVAHERVKADAGRVAIERGPLVYCFEAVDNGDRVDDLVIPPNSAAHWSFQSNLLGGVGVIDLAAQRVRKRAGATAQTSACAARAVPYYAWAHRKVGPMAVWMPASADHVADTPEPTIASRARASASHTGPGDTVHAINDQKQPAASHDPDVPRHTWRDHLGTREWVQLDFPAVTQVRRVAIYWVDDGQRGRCRVPKSWRLLFRSGNDWLPVESPDALGVERDRFNVTTFDPLRTTALRVEVQLQDGASGGVLEWKVE